MIRTLRHTGGHEQGEQIVVGGISACLLLALATGTQSCRRAEGEKGGIKPRMSVADVFEVTNDWNLNRAHSSGTETQTCHNFSLAHYFGAYSLATHEPEGYRTIGSRDELIEAVEKEMGDGYNWHIELT